LSSPNAPVSEYSGVDTVKFRDQIFPLGQPAVLRGIVRQWPAVQQGSLSPQAMCDYLLGMRQGNVVSLATAPPAIKGRLFYREDLQGPNFERHSIALASGLQTLLSYVDDPEPPTLYMEAARLAECLPDFAASNRLELLDDSIAPRIWIGNAVTVQTHYDFLSNIACVVAGRRRFTLFPPEQLPNLYPGPPDMTPAGVPLSMVQLENPDFKRYPRFKEALEAARVAELEPGDALFIPYGWWHHVQSLAPLNVLVNYWWFSSRPATSPLDCLLHGVITLRDMQPDERAVWRNLFDYYIFQTSGDPLAHLAPNFRGVMGSHTPEQFKKIKAALARSLAQ
jgi:Cupin-like domain